MTTIRAFLLAAACLLPTLGLAASVTLNPVADAYVQNGSNANRNYGNGSQLRVQTSSTASSNYDSYLKFDTAAATGTVTSAKLRLYASLSKAGNVNSSVHGVADTGWGETTITWNNKPALGAVLGSLSTTSTSSAWKEIDVTAYVQAEQAAGRNLISLGLHNAATSSFYVRANSRNATSKRPELVIFTAAANVAPTVSLTSPADGASFTAPASITLSANASDSDGSIASVAFYNGATIIGTVTGAPYSFTWSNVAAGSYSLTARATDNQGASIDSAPVTVTVTDQPVAAGVYYVYADHLSTPRVITDGTNKVVWRWDSDPFGADAANEDPDGDGTKFRYNLRFPGQYYDRETGLHYNYFRDYEPGTGRYVQADPIGLAGGINLYGYVGGNPISKFDPLGLIEWSGTAVSAGIRNAGKTRYTLVSECIDGYKTEVVVDADLYTFGAGASWTKSAVNFTDDFNYVNPYVFDGVAFNVSAGVAARFGTAFDLTILGGASSPGAWSAQSGTGAWIGFGGGRSKVISTKSTPCSCPSR